MTSKAPPDRTGQRSLDVFLDQVSKLTEWNLPIIECVEVEVIDSIDSTIEEWNSESVANWNASPFVDLGWWKVVASEIAESFPLVTVCFSVEITEDS